MALLDNCYFTSGSSGTADFADGIAGFSYRNLENAGAEDGKVYSYKALNSDGLQWEIGRGTALNTSGGWILERTTVDDSSDGGSKVDFNSPPDVVITPSVADFEQLPIPPPQGRLTLASGIAVTTSDIVGAVTVYYTPCVGAALPIYGQSYDGPRYRTIAFDELSLILDADSGHTGYHQSGKNFDLFVFDDAGTLRLGTGPAWLSDTARGTGGETTELELYQGIWINKNSITIRHSDGSGDTEAISARQATYVGTMRTTADGLTEDSAAKRFLWNAYCQTLRPMARFESAANWVYATGTLRQANGNTANQLDFICGLDGVMVGATLNAAVNGEGVSSGVGRIAIGLDSTTTPAEAAHSSAIRISTGGWSNANAAYEGYPGIGRHVLTWLEMASGSGTPEWLGTNIGWKSGLLGRILG